MKSTLKNLLGNVKDIFSGIKSAIKNAWSAAWSNAKSGAKNTWSAIKSVFSNVGTFFKDTFKKAWDKVKNVFSSGGKVFDGIKDGIVDAFKKVVNSLIDGINKVVKKPFEGLNEVLDKIQNVSILGAKPFDFISWRAPIPQIPKLASGGYVAANTPQLAIVGDNKREGEIIAPESKITEAVVAAFRQFLPMFGNSGNNKQPIYLTIKLGDGTFWEGFVDYHNDIVKRTGDTPLLV
jgi:phage-related minor tail protein